MLHAFKEVLQAFQFFGKPARNACRIPIFPSGTFKTTKHMSAGEMLAFGLCWSLLGKLLIDLTFKFGAGQAGNQLMQPVNP